VFNITGEMTEDSEEYSFEEYDSITERYFKMDVGACEFDVSEGNIDGDVRIDSVYPKSYQSPELESSFKDGKLDLEFNGASAEKVFLFYDESKYDISFGNLDTPTSFDVKLGAGSGSMVFDDLKVKDFWAEVGAGKLEVDFSREALPSGEVRFSVGAGKIILNIPDTSGYELTYDLGVGNIQVEGKDISGISGGRGKYTSSNYTSAESKLNIFVSVGVGEFNIVSN